jgi:hypothetical protein
MVTAVLIVTLGMPLFRLKFRHPGAPPSPPRNFSPCFTAGSIFSKRFTAFTFYRFIRFVQPCFLRRELGTIELQVKNEKNPDSVPKTYRQFAENKSCKWHFPLRRARGAASDSACKPVTTCAGDFSRKAQTGL